MPDVICLHAKSEVAAFCCRNPFLHLYSLGDLDDFFWSHTTWYALRRDGAIRQLALFYSDLTMRIPTLLTYAEQPTSEMSELLRALRPVLPRRFYAHLTASTTDALTDDYRLHSHGAFHKLGLTDAARITAVNASEAVALSTADLDDLVALYDASYPAHWFVPRMLQTGCYYGIRRDGALVSVAGVHVYSPEFRVAALGNIATRPEARGQGLATVVTARLCQELLNVGITTIGLNVNAANAGALACYTRLGFERIADYGEYTVESA